MADLFVSLGMRPDGKSFANSRRELQRFGQVAERDAKGIGARISASIGRGLTPTGFGKDIRTALQGAALGAGAAFGVALKDALNFDEGLTRLDIASRGAMGSMAQVRAQILGVSEATGVAKEELLAGANSFLALTGDGKAAAATLQTFARVQKATGTSMEDISASAAAMTQQLGIGAGEMEKAFSILAAGGKAGAVEFKDMGSLMASLSAQFSKFGDSQGTRGLASLGAAFQVARQGFGSAAETATGLEALMGSLVQNAAKLKKSGVGVFEADGKTLKSLDGIVEALAGKGFNATKVFEILGRKEAVAAFNQLTKNRKAWGDLAKATESANDISKDYDRFNRSSAAQLQKSWNGLKTTIADAFTPDRVEGFTMALGGMLTILGKAAGLFETVVAGGGTLAAMVAEKLGLVETESPAMAAERRRQNPAYQERKAKFGSLLGTRSDESLAMLAKHAGARGEMGQMGLEARAEIDRRSQARSYNVADDASRSLDVPTMLESDAARGAFAPQTTINITAPAGLDEQGVARLVGNEVDRVLEVKARELDAHLGGD